jgi:hypothetical protein
VVAVQYSHAGTHYINPANNGVSHSRNGWRPENPQEVSRIWMNKGTVAVSSTKFGFQDQGKAATERDVGAIECSLIRGTARWFFDEVNRNFQTSARA